MVGVCGGIDEAGSLKLKRGLEYDAWEGIRFRTAKSGSLTEPWGS